MEQQCIFGNSILENRAPACRAPFLCYPGKCLDGTEGFSLGRSELSKHVLLLGGAGSGKTNAFSYTIEKSREEMTDTDVAVIFDTKGEFYEMFRREGDYVIGNSSQFRSISNVWNIFDEILIDGDAEEQVQANAKEIAAALFHGRGSESQPFFCNAAKDIFAAILIHFVRIVKQKPELRGKWLNNRSLMEAFHSFKVTDYVKIFQYHKDMNMLLSYIGDGTSNQALGVFAELNSMLSEYFVGILAEHDPQRSVSMRKIVRERGGKAVFVEYDLSSGETLAPVYRLLVDQALKEALGRHGGNARAAGKVFLFADEFKLLPKLQHIDDALNFGRGLGVSVMAGIQSVDQLYDIYGKEKGAVIAGGFGSLFAFHTNDDSSRAYIRDRFGPNRIAVTYKSNSQNKMICSERDGYTAEVWDQMNLGVGQAIIGICENAPFLFAFAEYGK